MDRPIKILFLAANPEDTSQLRLDEEMRGIDQALRQSEFRDKFDIKQHWAVRVIDLQGYLLRHKPDIVHFSGHGSASNEIILEDLDGNSQIVSSLALSQLFSVLKDNIRCVVLNACYSEQQAQAIAKNIDCVIGMSKAIGDSAAISFAVAFYQALGYGRGVKTAFDLGCVQINLESLAEQDIPKLLANNVNPKAKEIRMCGWSLGGVIGKNRHKLREALQRGCDIRILLLDPNSSTINSLDSAIVGLDLLERKYHNWPPVTPRQVTKSDVLHTIEILKANNVACKNRKMPISNRR